MRTIYTAAVGAVADTGGVYRALGGRQRHRHRHLVVDGLLGLGFDLDAGEVVQPRKRFAEAVELALVVITALFPVHQLVEQVIADDVLRRLHEGGRAHVVAAAAVPHQVDVGGMLGARDLDSARGEVGIEVTALGQAAGDADLAGLVGGVVEHVARMRPERSQVLLEIAVLAAFAQDGDVRAPHAYRLVERDRDFHRQRIAFADALHLDPWRVVAERLQRLAGLVFRLAQQVGQAAAGQLLADRIDQRQGAVHVEGLGLVQPLDLYCLDLGRLGRADCGPEQRSDGHGAKGVGHGRRITGHLPEPG